MTPWVRMIPALRMLWSSTESSFRRKPEARKFINLLGPGFRRGDLFRGSLRLLFFIFLSPGVQSAVFLLRPARRGFGGQPRAVGTRAIIHPPSAGIKALGCLDDPPRLS